MRWVHRALSLVFVLLCSFPAMLMASSVVGRPLVSVFLTALLGFVVAAFLSMFFTRRYRVIGVIVLIVLNVGIGVWLFSDFVSIVEPALMLVAQIITLGLSVSFDRNPITFREFGIGASFYGIAYAIFYLNMMNEPLPLLSVFCVIYMVYSIVLMNFNAVSDAGYLPRKVNGSLASTLRGGNMILTVIFLAVALVLVNIGAIKDAFAYAVGRIFIFILWLMSLAAGEQSAPGGGDGGGMFSELFAEETKTMAPWLEALLNIVMYVITVAVLIVLMGLLCRVVYKGIKKLIALIRKWLGAQAELHEGGTGYTDERSRLQRNQLEQEDKEPRAGLLRRLMHRLPKWKDLDERARVRFALQMTMYPERQSNPDRTRTAREILDKATFAKEGRMEAFAAAYDRARYSSGQITSQDVESAKSLLDRK